MIKSSEEKRKTIPLRISKVNEMTFEKRGNVISIEHIEIFTRNLQKCLRLNST